MNALRHCHVTRLPERCPNKTAGNEPSGTQQVSRARTYCWHKDTILSSCPLGQPDSVASNHSTAGVDGLGEIGRTCSTHYLDSRQLVYPARDSSPCAIMAATLEVNLSESNLATSQYPTTSQGVSSGGAAAAAGIGFQAQLGALFGLQLLAQVPVDHVLELGAAVPVWVRFETEAPVDDILVTFNLLVTDRYGAYRGMVCQEALSRC